MEAIAFDHPAGPYAAALLAGVTYGLACCGPTCGPFLCAYIMCFPAGAAQAAKSLAVFTTARVATLGGLGFAAAFLGKGVVLGADDGGCRSLVLRGVIVLLGVLMWLRPAAGDAPDERIHLAHRP